jgi:dihydroorotase
MQTCFWPDSFSTDWNTNAHQTGVIDLPNCMSKFLGLGMSVDQVIARAAVNPSRMFPLFNDRGTLNVGAPADVAMLELRDGNFDFLDNFNNKIQGKQRLFPSGTVLAGKRVQRA